MKKEKATSQKESSLSNEYGNGNKKLPSKLVRVAECFATGRSLNRFEAERAVNDHCLPSTMSTIKNKYGIMYQTRTEIVPGWCGMPTRVSRYWFDREGRNRLRVLSSWLRARGSRTHKEVTE